MKKWHTNLFYRNYLISIFILCFIIIGLNSSFYKLINSTDNYATIINIAGKKRMISQELYILLIDYKDKPNELNRNQILNSIKEMEDSDDFLITQGYSKEVINITKNYLFNFKQYLKTNDIQYILTIKSQLKSVLESLNNETNRYVEKSKNSLILNKEYLIFMTFLILLIILFKFLFVIKPIINEINKKTKKLSIDNELLIEDINKKIIQLKEANKIAKIGIWEFDIVKKELNWSDEIFNMFDLDKNKFNPSYETFIELIHPNDREIVNNAYLKSLENTAPYEIKHRLLMKDGTIKWVYEKCHTIFDENKNPLLSTGIVQDITLEEKEKKQEQLLLQQAKMVSMGEMIGNIAHQWRQPLSIISTAMIKLNLKSELGKLQNDEIQDISKKVINHTQYLSKTIEIFTDYIKGEKISKNYGIQEEIKQAISLLSSVIEDNNIKLIDEIDYDDVIIVKQTTGELAEVLINILNNAKDALIYKNIENKYIKISIKKEEQKATIKIEDNAQGIDERIIHRIFEPYFTTKHKSQGTGLGLHICHKIITESFDGKIYAKNKNNGAIINIEIPF
jgi:PAS domain S-box-containing protein